MLGMKGTIQRDILRASIKKIGIKATLVYFHFYKHRHLGTEKIWLLFFADCLQEKIYK